MAELSAWDSFYVIVGSAAGALIGLQFVVMTLIADKPQAGMSEAGRAFATPTVVHFGACLLLSALVQIPWHEVSAATWAAGAVGFCGFAYMALPVQRMRRQNIYQMDMEDWPSMSFCRSQRMDFWRCPCLLGIAHRGSALFGVAAASLVLLFTGIHNAWDAVAYQVYVVRRKKHGRALTAGDRVASGSKVRIFAPRPRRLSPARLFPGYAGSA